MIVAQEQDLHQEIEVFEPEQDSRGNVFTRWRARVGGKTVAMGRVADRANAHAAAAMGIALAALGGEAVVKAGAVLLR